MALHEENVSNETKRHMMVIDNLMKMLDQLGENDDVGRDGSDGNNDTSRDDAAKRHVRSTSLDTPLNEHIPDRRVRKIVIDALATCPPKNGQTAALVRQILAEHGLWSSKLLSKKFAAALLPHLTYVTTKEALYMAFLRL